MPNLQSIVIVFLKEILANVTAIANQNHGEAPNGQRERYAKYSYRTIYAIRGTSNML